MSQDNVQIHQPAPNHYYRTEIPNIVRELGLDPYTLAVYFYIKSIAGDYGTCFTSYKKMCEHAGMGRTKLIECLNNLVEGKNKLGIRLLAVTQQFRLDGGQGSNIYEVIDIWKDNGEFYRKKSIGGTSSERPPVLQEYAPGTPNGHKEEPITKNHNTGLANSRLAGSELEAGEPKDEVVSEKIFYQCRSGSLKSISRSEVFASLGSSGFEAQVIGAAIKKFSERKGRVGDPIKLIALMCEDILKQKAKPAIYKESVYKEIKNPTKLKLR